jgi:oligopeptidase A
MSEASTLPENPLLAPTGIALFGDFRPEHVEPGVQVLLERLEGELAGLELVATPTFEGLVDGIEGIHDRLHYVWGLVSHLLSVRNTPELRAAHDAMQSRVIDFTMKAGQSRAVFEKLTQLRESAGWQDLEEAQQRTVRALLHVAKLSGVALEGAAKERFNNLQQELAELGTRFSNHVLDATQAFRLDLTREDEVAGLPHSLRALAAQASPVEGASAESGPWRITLEAPSCVPFLMHSRRRDLREQVFKAQRTRASSGELDNSELIVELLRKRGEAARILGFRTWAEQSLSSKMAPDIVAVEKLLEELRVVAYPAAERELEELIEFARAQGAPEADDFQLWDRPYWSERLREARFDFSAEDLRPYFPMQRVLEGLFDLARRLFGISVREAVGQVSGWNEEVTYYVLEDEEGQELAAFFLDAYARSKDKRGGAWMNYALGRTRLFPNEQGSPRLPVAYIVCNFSPPIAGRPALLTFREVETIFHEFGHALQHMLTRVDYGLVAGIENVEWDAVELPSQFMENWCYHEPTLRGLARHHETGEPLPKALFDKIVAARTFQAGLGTLRQIEFALTDLELHHRFNPDGPMNPGGGESVLDVQERIGRLTSVGRRFEGDRYLCAFGHIFAGGYSAGYYSYKWAEVLSADAFSAFEEAGLDDERAIAKTGRRFRDTVLALGGSREPMDVFQEFRGRGPSTEPLLRHSGLA